MNKLKIHTLGLIFGLLVCATSTAQDLTESVDTNEQFQCVEGLVAGDGEYALPDALPDDFNALEQYRAEVSSAMFSIMYEVSGLFTELERTRKLEQQRDLLLASLRTATDEVESEQVESDLDQVTARLTRIRCTEILPSLVSVSGTDLSSFTEIEASEGFRRILENKVSEILRRTDDLNSIGSKVAELNNTDSVAQNFKALISWSFAELVFVVIVGFFWIAHGDEKVRRTIFSGDSGIQFLTLFSIVIAIILFGITGVLEGKEISALIGGISGYILGRSSVSTNKQHNEIEQAISQPALGDKLETE